MFFDEKEILYFDNAATSLPKPVSVIEAMTQAIQSFGSYGRGTHPPALQASRCIFKARTTAANLLGSTPERTIFTSNATESLNIAINGLLTTNDHVITTALEHNSVLRPLYRLQERGMQLSIIPANADGHIDYDNFFNSLRPNTKAVVCTHASNLTGLVIDLDFITTFCRQHGLMLIVDASQTAGVLPINADKQGIDVLCFTGHKGLMGPQGTGGICVGNNIAIEPLKVGGSGLNSYQHHHPNLLPEALEAGTLNSHGIAGLLAGIEYINQVGIQNILLKELALCQRFVAGIKNITNIKIYSDLTLPCVPIVALNIGSQSANQVGDLLAKQYNICVRAGAHCAPLIHTALGTQKQGAIRFSFGCFNTEQQIDLAITAITEIANNIR